MSGIHQQGYGINKRVKCHPCGQMLEFANRMMSAEDQCECIGDDINPMCILDYSHCDNCGARYWENEFEVNGLDEHSELIGDEAITWDDDPYPVPTDDTLFIVFNDVLESEEFASAYPYYRLV